MTPIKRAWAAGVLLLTARWLLAEPALSKPLSFIALRDARVTCTGVLPIGVMRLALLLRHAGRSRDAFGAAAQLQHHAGMQVLEVLLQLALHRPDAAPGPAPDSRPVDLFHAVPQLDARASNLLRQDAAAAHIHLHVLLDGRDGLLTGERLRALVPDGMTRDAWFCGPTGMGNALQRDLRAQGLPAAAFHQALFNMR